MAFLNNIRIEATECTPEIDFAFEENSYAMRSEAYEEDINEFFGPMIGQLEDCQTSLDGADVSFSPELIYFNNSAVKDSDDDF
jgi:hypothetical protein